MLALQRPAHIARQLVLRAPAKPSRITGAAYHDYVRAETSSECVSGPPRACVLKRGTGGNIRVPLNSPKVIGVANDRGNRGCVVTELFLPSPPATHKAGSSGFSRHQEDYYGVAALSLDPWELQKTARKNLKEVWDPTLVSDFMSRQVLFVGVYDGYVGILLQAIR